MIDREPAVIARYRGVADAMAAVDFASEDDRLVSVEGGEHNVAGNDLRAAGLVIDCSPMDSVRVDPDVRTPRSKAGPTCADFDHETQAVGLATTGGGVSTDGNRRAHARR